jgi:calcineurin-like phosphoesterase family protein
VLLGDIEPQRSLEVELAPILDKTEIHFIHGNHDTDTEANVRNLFESTLARRNLDGRVIEVAGVRIAGLGGVFRGKIWMPPAAANFRSYAKWRSAIKRSRVPIDSKPVDWVLANQGRTHRSTIFPDVYDRLSLLKADALVVHEAPSCHPHGFEAIDDLAQALGVKTVFHGHHHDRLDYSSRFDALGFRAYGVGFCGITDLEGRVVRAGEFDEDRAHRQENLR